MKNFNKRGFTLIEILVVIAIIGLLAGILVPVVSGAMARVTQGTTKSKFTSWCSAVRQYKMTYGYYPILNTGASTVADDTHYDLNDGKLSLNFVKALSGTDPETGDPLSKADRKSFNTKGKSFYEFTNSDYTQSDGTVEVGKLVDGFYNPHIHVVMDTNQNKRVILPQAYMPTDATDAEKDPKGIPGDVLIFTSKNDGEDYVDIYSWR